MGIFRILSPVVFAAVVFVCYGVLHPEWFNYHEQYQLFMFGWEYLSEHVAVASGMAGYMAEFVVQFYFFPILGAVMWAGLLVLMGWLVWKVARLLDGGCSHYALCFLPPLAVALYCGDENVMMAFPMSILLALVSAFSYGKSTCSWRGWAQVAVIPLLYWIMGYGVFVYAALSLALDRRKFGYDAARTLLMVGVYVVVISMTIVLVGHTVMKQYPFIDIVCGVNFYRERLVVPMMQHVVAVCCVVVPVVMPLLKQSGRVVAIVEAAVMALVLPVSSSKTFDNVVYPLLKIDYLVRNQEWAKVVKFCEQNPPTNDMGASGLNLALAMTGQLPDRMFEFPQYGKNGLLSSFERNMVSCGITAEACYYLGLINSVLRYNYDSQAAIVNCNMSGRFTRRIAEAYMLNGNYELAMKYADLLKKTVFYRPWAKRVEDCCKNPATIGQSKRWAVIMRHRLPENQLFSVTDMDAMLLNLYKHSPDNAMALQYSLACDLLDGKMKNFVNTMSQTFDDNSRMPRVYQEALAWVYLQRQGTLKGVPDFISNEVQADLRDFDRLYMMDRNNPQLRQGRLAKTFWGYTIRQ